MCLNFSPFLISHNNYKLPSNISEKCRIRIKEVFRDLWNQSSNVPDTMEGSLSWYSTPSFQYWKTWLLWSKNARESRNSCPHVGRQTQVHKLRGQRTWVIGREAQQFYKGWSGVASAGRSNFQRWGCEPCRELGRREVQRTEELVHSAGGLPALSEEQWGWAGVREGGSSRKSFFKDWASDPSLHEMGRLGGLWRLDYKEFPRVTVKCNSQTSLTEGMDSNLVGLRPRNLQCFSSQAM